MKKSLPTWIVLAALVLTLSGCAGAPAANTDPPAAEPQVTAELPAPAEAAPTEPAAEARRQNGERFETVIMLEGMEETVQYEHVVNETLGFEMDYDYEGLVRRSEADRELFLSTWDDPAAPENYLEVRYDSGNADLVADAISVALSNEYDITTETRTLDSGLDCIRIEASVIKGTNQMAQQLQAVYIIPASDGCRVAAAHYAIEAAEGFGRRFAYMINTLAVLDRTAGGTLTDEQALAAVRRYCLLSNPSLEEVLDAGEYPVYWEIASSDAQQVVVLFRSYTGALVRYYIDRSTGEAAVTEFVPGITPEEMPTDESLNVWPFVV